MATSIVNFDFIKTLDFVKLYESETGWGVTKNPDNPDRPIHGNVCPLCGSGTHTHHTGAFSIYPQTNSFYCQVCSQGGTVIDFVMKSKHCNERQAAEYLNVQYFGGRATTDTQAVAPTYQIKQLKQQPTRNNAVDGDCKIDGDVNAEIFRLVDEAGGDADLLAYLDGRGITADIRARWCVRTFTASMYYTINTKLKKSFGLDRLRRAGVMSAKDNFLFCFHRILLFNRNNNGDFLNIKARAVPGTDTENKSKYMNQRGDKFPFCTSAIYTAQPGDTVAIVEGEFDAIALNELGNPAVAVGGVGDNPKVYRGLLALIACRGLSVVPCFDNDEGGQRAENKFKDIAQTINGLRYEPGRVPNGGKDWADILQQINVTNPADLDTLEPYLTTPRSWRVGDLAHRENLSPLAVRRAFMDFVKLYNVRNITFNANYELITIN